MYTYTGTPYPCECLQKTEFTDLEIDEVTIDVSLGVQIGCKLVTLRCTSSPFYSKHLYYFSKIRSYFEEVVQIFDLKRIEGSSNGHQFTPQYVAVNEYATSEKK